MRYSQGEKDVALSILDEQAGNFTQASIRSRVPVKTLRRWVKERQAQQNQAIATLDEKVEILRERAYSHSQQDSPEKVPLLSVQEQMLISALALAESLRKDIEEAPLNQRATALNQLMDKILKMTEQLPENSEQVIRIEYLDPDGSIHSTPYWARDDSDS